MVRVPIPGFVRGEGPADPDPYESFAWMRSAMPVAAVPGADRDTTAWFVTSYEAARACLADPRLSNDRRNAAVPDGHPVNQGDLLGQDPPEHARLRRLVSPLLSPGATERLRPHVRRVCAAQIDEFADRGRAELVGEYAWPIPWAVIHDYFGIPDEQRMEAGRCVDRFLVAGYAEQEQGSGPATEELMDYVRQLIDFKRGHRGEDMATVLIDARKAGELRSEAELEGLLYLLLGAGLVSTGPMLAAAALRLLQNPGELAKLRDGRAAWRDAVEESLRYDSPVQTSVSRWALEDLELGGTVIPRGSAVVISFAAANRDPGRFAGPESFGVARRRSHLAFGHGVHLCVGAPLARLEGEVALELLFTRLANPRLDEGRALGWILGPKLRSPREVPALFDVP
jgi:cytochrome P450